MALTVVDNSNLAAMLTESGVESPETPLVEASADEPKPEGDKPADEPKPTDEAKPEGDPEDADDVEDDEGITARQKRELSAKMLKAIGKKHRQVKEAEEFAAHQYREKTQAEARAVALERELNAVKSRDKPAPKAEDVEPQRENFATETEYIDAKIKYGVDQGIRQREAENAARARQQQVQQMYQRAAELVPDFERVTDNMPPLPQGVVAYIQESDMFAELGYHLAKNPEAAAKLVSLTPTKQLVELGRIEATLKPFGARAPKAADEKSDNGKADKATPSAIDTGFSPSNRTRSDAPVIKPISGGEGAQVDPDVREMNTRQMIERYQRDKKVNLHARKRH
jgi:hypothetical protein